MGLGIIQYTSIQEAVIMFIKVPKMYKDRVQYISNSVAMATVSSNA